MYTRAALVVAFLPRAGGALGAEPILRRDFFQFWREAKHVIVFVARIAHERFVCTIGEGANFTLFGSKTGDGVP